MMWSSSLLNEQFFGHLVGVLEAQSHPGPAPSHEVKRVEPLFHSLFLTSNYNTLLAPFYFFWRWKVKLNVV